MRTRLGAWVLRARFAAVLGRPMPTNNVTPSRSARAAATVMKSSGVNCPIDLLVQPLLEPFPISGNGIPRAVGLVVAVVVALRIRGMGATRRLRHAGDRPVRQHDRARYRLELLHALLDGHQGPLRCQHRLL